MILKKTYLLFIFIILLSTACSDDDSFNGLRYDSSEILQFRVFAGSVNGGKSIDTTLNVTRYFPTSSFESFTNTTIAFTDNIITIMQNAPLPEKSLYRFEKNTLFIESAGRWQYYGFGDKNNLTINQHYIGYRQPGEDKFTVFRANPQSNIDSLIAVKQTPYITLEDMKSEKDTLIWCTRHSYFR